MALATAVLFALQWAGSGLLQAEPPWLAALSALVCVLLYLPWVPPLLIAGLLLTAHQEPWAEMLFPSLVVLSDAFFAWIFLLRRFPPRTHG